MGTYTIGEVAERTGFTTSALRYYEGIGLVAASGRTGAGYRLYDDHALARLAFVARAKQLGCSLEEITDLVAVWDGERCEPVQRRLHELVTAKIADARSRAAELVALTGQLQHAASQLARPATDGSCDEGCACLGSRPAPGSPVPVPLVDAPGGPPVACTLPAEAMPERLSAWQRVLAHVGSRTTTADGALRVVFTSDVDLEELARLVAAEQTCCSFFSFAITVDHRGVALEVRAPAGAADLVDAVFGAAA